VAATHHRWRALESAHRNGTGVQRRHRMPVRAPCFFREGGRMVPSMLRSRNLKRSAEGSRSHRTSAPRSIGRAPRSQKFVLAGGDPGAGRSRGRPEAGRAAQYEKRLKFASADGSVAGFLRSPWPSLPNCAAISLTVASNVSVFSTSIFRHFNPNLKPAAGKSGTTTYAPAGPADPGRIPQNTTGNVSCYRKPCEGLLRVVDAARRIYAAFHRKTPCGQTQENAAHESRRWPEFRPPFAVFPFSCFIGLIWLRCSGNCISAGQSLLGAGADCSFA